VISTVSFARPRVPTMRRCPLGSVIRAHVGRSSSRVWTSAAPSMNSSLKLATSDTRPGAAPSTSDTEARPSIAAAIEAFWSQAPSP
jgi:hypothetical protein